MNVGARARRARTAVENTGRKIREKTARLARSPARAASPAKTRAASPARSPPARASPPAASPQLLQPSPRHDYVMEDEFHTSWPALVAATRCIPMMVVFFAFVAWAR